MLIGIQRSECQRSGMHDDFIVSDTDKKTIYQCAKCKRQRTEFK